MNRKPMLSFMPLRESALKRSDPLGRWIYQCYSEIGRSIDTLDPEGWFVRGHDHGRGEENIDGFWIPKFRLGTFICNPSPGVARIII